MLREAGKEEQKIIVSDITIFLKNDDISYLYPPDIMKISHTK